MTLYAASNIAETTVPVEAGGCGIPHGRPVIDGVPQHPWGLQCPPCEDFLRSKMPTQWSTTIAEIPETYDEKITREDFEKRGAFDERKLMAMALARLTGLEIPQTISGALPVGMRPVTGGLLECPSGHAQPPGQKFCGECGAPMSAPVAQTALPPSQPPPAATPAAAKAVPRMRDGRVEVLQAFARANGLDDTGGRKELIPRLSAAGLVGKWTAFATAYQPETAAA